MDAESRENPAPSFAGSRSREPDASGVKAKCSKGRGNLERARSSEHGSDGDPEQNDSQRYTQGLIAGVEEINTR
jgi:hypothetical protein